MLSEVLWPNSFISQPLEKICSIFFCSGAMKMIISFRMVMSEVG